MADIDATGANTLEIPIYWQQFEPTEGHLDPSVQVTMATYPLTPPTAQGTVAPTAHN